mmetsp:Transcript_11833/g.17640  ORF Transcript_11833/g.17640 Transcript_11833/m.17640 type:complete len:107 (-) Transcript_11833:63-383(-)
MPTLIDSSTLWALSKTIGKECADCNLEYMQCKNSKDEPEKCAREGDKVMKCVERVAEDVQKGPCSDNFQMWLKCLSGAYKREFLACRDLQTDFETCNRENAQSKFR